MNRLSPEDQNFFNEMRSSNYADTILISPTGKTALMVAVLTEQLEKIVEVYYKNPDLLNVTDNMGEHVMFIVFGRGFSETVIINEILDFLLTQPGCDRNYQKRVSIKNQTQIETLMNLKFSKNSDKGEIIAYAKKYKICNIAIVDLPILPFYEPDISIDFLQMMITDDVNKFILNFTRATERMLLIACEYNAINIATYCIENNFGINFISTSKTSAFTYCCFLGQNSIFRSLIDLTSKNNLLMLNIYGRDSYSYITDLSMRGFRKIILDKPNENEYENDFKIYRDTDFEYINYETINVCGAAGEIRHIVEKSTGRNMIMKRYRDCPQKYVLVDSYTVKEIAFLLMVNRIKRDTAVTVLGIYINSEGCIFLIMEYLPYTLTQILDDIAYLNVEHRIDIYRDILSTLLEKLNNLASLGIVHNDIKDPNIMMDINGRLKIIDFGITQFFGLLPLKEYYFDKKGTFYTLAPDGNKALNIPEFLGDYQNIDKKTFTSDIFSVGSMMLNQVFGTGVRKYIYDRELVSYSGYDILEHYQNPEMIEIINQFNQVDPRFIDLLTRMVQINSQKRENAKSLLQDNFFDFASEQVFVRGDSIVGFECNFYFYERTNQLELAYQYDMLTNLDQGILKYPTLLSIDDRMQILDIILEYCNGSYNFDVIINTIIKVLNLVAFTDLDYIDYLHGYFILMSYILNRQNIQLSSWNERYPDNRVIETMSEIITKKESYSFVAARTFIYDKVYNLQIFGYNQEKIAGFANDISVFLLKWCLFCDGGYDLNVVIYHICELSELRNDLNLEKMEIDDDLMLQLNYVLDINFAKKRDNIWNIDFFGNIIH